MANLILPIFTKNKYTILEMIVLILQTNSGTKLTPAEIDNLFNHPQVASHLNRKSAKDSIKSIIWCYQQYHNNEGQFPELGFDGTYFYMNSNGTVNNSDLTKEVSVINRIGNDPENTGHRRSLVVAKQGDMIYISTIKGIYKMREGSKTLKKVCDVNYLSCFLNVVGEWLYFVEENKIYKVKVNGQDKKTIFDLEKYTGTKECGFTLLIVIGDRIFFSTKRDDEGGIPFLASIGTDGKALTCLFIPDKKYVYYKINSIKILGAGENYLFFKINAEEHLKFIIKTDGSKCGRLYQCFNYKKILANYIEDSMTEEEIRYNFECSVKYIDFSEGWVFLQINQQDNYDLYKMKLNGSQLQPAWREADWRAYNIKGYKNYYHDGYAHGYNYFNGKVSIGIGDGVSLFRCYPNGTVVNLHGNTKSMGYELLVSGNYAYWGGAYSCAHRLNINTGAEEVINFEKLTVQEV